MLVGLDFETDSIMPRPDYPPEPKGCAILRDDNVDAGFYYAWGHPSGNNCDKDVAYREIAEYFEDPEIELVMHNAAFDCAVAYKHLQVQIPWGRIHDTMLYAFIDHPFGELSLKPLSDLALGMPPEEQEELRQWLISHGVVRSGDKNWGAHICKAPGNIVAPYAIGDVMRTLKLLYFYAQGGSTVGTVHTGSTDTDTSEFFGGRV